MDNMPLSREGVLRLGYGAGPLIACTEVNASEYIAYGPANVCWVVTDIHDGYTTSRVEIGTEAMHTEVHAVVLVVEDVGAGLELFAGAGGLQVARAFRSSGRAPRGSGRSSSRLTTSVLRLRAGRPRAQSSSRPDCRAAERPEPELRLRLFAAAGSEPV